MSYRGRGGSGSNTPTRNGRGGAPAGRGRGRGRGNVLNDFTAQGLDYESKVNIADKKGAVESQDAITHINASSRPTNVSSNTFGRQASTIDTPQQAASSSNPSRNPSMHYNQGQRRAFKPFNASSSSGFNPYGPQSSNSQQASPYNKSNGFQHQHGRAHTGIGAGNRKPEHLGHDPSLTRPITFVKAVNVMQPTMDKEEHDRLLAKQRLEDLFKSAAGPLSPPTSQPAAPALVPLPPATKSEAMSREVSHTSSGSKGSSASKVLSPHAAVFSLPSFLGEHKPTAQYSPTVSVLKQDNGKGKGKAIDNKETEHAPSFFIDTIGDVNAASAGIAQMSLPQKDIVVPSARKQPQAVELENAEDDEESETEELFPRRQSAKTAVANGLAPSKQEMHLPITSYARTITDNIPMQPTRPVPRLSADGQTILLNATATTNGRANQAAPSKKAAKKQAKQAAKERKKDRKSGKNRIPSYKQKKIARDADSDLDWGSDGPPASTLRDDYEEAEQSMMSVEISQTRQSKKKAGQQNGRGRKGKLSAVDLAIEDLANASMRLHDDGDDSDEMGAMSEAELSALRSFAKSMSAGEHLTLDDLDDIQNMREEDAEEDTTDEESDDSVDAEELERLRTAIEGDKYPVYIPKPTEWESDPEDERNTLFKSDDESDADGTSKTAWEEAGRKIMQDTSKTASPESSDSESSASAKDLIIEAEEEVLMVESDSDAAEEAVEGKVTQEADSEEEEEEAEEEDEEDEDEDEDEEDMLMRFAKPAKKKREAPTFESDFFDDLLQAQWLKDKQKKAIRKQEKALQRLEQKPNKSNAKKAKRASAKAKAYDLDDDFDVLGGADLRLSGGKVPEFHKINTDLRDFIDNSGYGEYPLPPMDKKFRYAIHMLADAYNLKSKSRGTGRDRHNVLYRTQQTTTRFANNFKIQKYLSITSTWKSGGSKSYSYEYSKTSTAKRGGAGGNVSRNHEGAVVGEGADKIASDNIGHKMLALMGWSEGMQIGKTGGIHEPLKAIVKTSKAGLGSGWVRYNRGSATPGATEEVLGTW